MSNSERTKRRPNSSESPIDPDSVFADAPLWLIADNTLRFAKPGYVEENGDGVKKTKPATFEYGEAEITAAFEARGTNPDTYFLMGVSRNPDDSVDPFRYVITQKHIIVEGKKKMADVLSDGTNRQIDEVERKRIRAIMARTNLHLTRHNPMPTQASQSV